MQARWGVVGGVTLRGRGIPVKGGDVVATHKVSDEFMDALLEGGILHPVLQAIRSDDTLMLGLRGGYVSIYYRGGQLLRLGEAEGRKSDGKSYPVHFDLNYDANGKLAERLRRSGNDVGLLARPIMSLGDAQNIVDVLGELKGLMDIHPKIRSGHEREFQQLVARENNRTRSAGATEYFITDIEHASGKARFDMLGARWGHDERKRGDCLLPVLFEMKYGEAALEGSAGIASHMDDILCQMKDQGARERLRSNVEAHFNQLSELGLLAFNRSSAIRNFTVVKDRVRVIFVLAGYNPRSARLNRILEGVDKSMRKSLSEFEALGIDVDLRFFHGCFCGYAMHDESMLTLGQLNSVMKSWQLVDRSSLA